MKTRASSSGASPAGRPGSCRARSGGLGAAVGMWPSRPRSSGPPPPRPGRTPWPGWTWASSTWPLSEPGPAGTMPWTTPATSRTPWAGSAGPAGCCRGGAGPPSSTPRPGAQRHRGDALAGLRRAGGVLSRRAGPVVYDPVTGAKTFRQPSAGWLEAKNTLARAHARVARLRADALCKLTTTLARTYGTIVVEDLNVAGMLRNPKLARHLASASFGEIRRQLAYKTGWNGGRLVVADRWYPSSKTCSACQTVKTKLSLSVRVFTCEHCGLVLDRDVNPALKLAALAVKKGLICQAVFRNPNIECLAVLSVREMLGQVGRQSPHHGRRRQGGILVGSDISRLHVIEGFVAGELLALWRDIGSHLCAQIVQVNFEILQL